MASPTKTSPLGWIGLGSMGLGMATSLQKHLASTNSPPLYFTNRTLSRGDPLVELGAKSCGSAAEVVKNSEITFISVSDDAALADIASQITIPGKDLAGKIIVDTTTVHPDTSFSISKILSSCGALFVAAPVSGASPLARSGQVLFLVSGPAPATSRISPYLKGVMGRDAVFLGEGIRQAGLMKTLGNFLTAAMMEVISEAHVLAEKTGLGSSALESLIESDYPGEPFSISQRLTTGAYMPAIGDRPMSDINLAIKDISHGISCANSSGTSLPIAEIAVSHLEEAQKYIKSLDEERNLDSSSMCGILRQNAGLDFKTDIVKERDGKL